MYQISKTTKNNKMKQVNVNPENVTEFEKTKRTDISFVDVRSIIVRPTFNKRKIFGDLEALAESIRNNGIIAPMRGYREKINGVSHVIVKDGERRMRAVEILLNQGVEFKRVPVIIGHKSSMEDQILEMVISNDGLPMTTLEEGLAFAELINFGWTPKEVASRAGRTQGHVSNALALAKAPKTIQDSINVGEISSSEALKVLRENGDYAEAAKVVDEAIKVAKAEGKTKATAKHVTPKKEKEVFAYLDEDGQIQLFTNFKANFKVTRINMLDELPENVQTTILHY